MTYDVDYFIEKFEKIPERNWCVGHYMNRRNHRQKCALGHCGDNMKDGGSTPEAKSLSRLLRSEVIEINDGESERYLQPTPKQRILAALRDVKERELSR